jgi:hypothetical protein
MERNPEQIRERQAERKATADKAMGRLAVLMAAAQIGDGDGDGDAGQIWPPLPPGAPPIAPRFQGKPRFQGTPRLQGTPRPTGIQPLGTPWVQLGLRQGTPLERPLLLNTFVRQHGPQTARFSYPPATPRAVLATTTATPTGLRGQQQPQQRPIIPGPGDSLLQADGTSHVPPGLGLAQPAPPPPGYNPYSYVAPHLRATGTQNGHQMPPNPVAAGGAYFRQQ